MIERVISGGQTGADQAGWVAAKRFGIPTGGWMPRGFKTEFGNKPEFADMYGAWEHELATYPPRTVANVQEADLTCWFGNLRSSGYMSTLFAVKKHKKKFVQREPGYPTEKFVEAVRNARIINIAGHRLSTDNQIYDRTLSYLCEVFRILGYKEVSPRWAEPWCLYGELR